MSKSIENQQALRLLVEDEHKTLLNILLSHLYRAGLVTPENAESTAHELLNEVVVEAMSHADRLDDVQSPTAWLVGIGINLVRRRVAKVQRDTHREPLARDMVGDEAQVSDAELFDQLSAISHQMTSESEHNPEQAMIEHQHLEWLLSHVSESDRDVLTLAFLQGLSGAHLASELNITEGAARVRLHRAIRRLKAALPDRVGE